MGLHEWLVVCNCAAVVAGLMAFWWPELSR